MSSPEVFFGPRFLRYRTVGSPTTAFRTPLGYHTYYRDVEEICLVRARCHEGRLVRESHFTLDILSIWQCDLCLLLIKVAQGESSWNRSHVMRTNKCVVVRNECLNMYVTFSPGHEYRYLCVYVSWMEHGTWTREIVAQENDDGDVSGWCGGRRSPIVPLIPKSSTGTGYGTTGLLHPSLLFHPAGTPTATARSHS